MRVCDRCKDPAKKSAKTMKDQHGGEIELCKECDAEFIDFLNAAPRGTGQAKHENPAGKAAQR